MVMALWRFGSGVKKVADPDMVKSHTRAPTSTACSFYKNKIEDLAQETVDGDDELSDIPYIQNFTHNTQSFQINSKDPFNTIFTDEYEEQVASFFEQTAMFYDIACKSLWLMLCYISGVSLANVLWLRSPPMLTP